MPNPDNNKQEQDEQNKDAAVKPEAETLHTTDPQEHMEGPISSLVQSVKKTVNDTEETKDSADKKKDKDM